MTLERLEKLRKIVRDASRIRGLKAWYEDKISISTCDKYGAAFCGDKSFEVFNAGEVFFDCYTGYYGNSGCSRPFSVADPDASKKAFRLAINKHKWLILETMADYLMGEANSIRQSAELEIKEAQELLESVQKEAEDALRNAVEGGRADG